MLLASGLQMASVALPETFVPRLGLGTIDELRTRVTRVTRVSPDRRKMWMTMERGEEWRKKGKKTTIKI